MAGNERAFTPVFDGLCPAMTVLRVLRMSSDTRVRNYWREEFGLIALLLIIFGGVIVFSIRLPFDAKLFPMVIGSAGLVLCLAILVDALRKRAITAPADVVPGDDPAARATWPRFATALLSAPVFGLVFWLFGFYRRIAGRDVRDAAADGLFKLANDAHRGASDGWVPRRVLSLRRRRQSSARRRGRVAHR